MRWRIWYCWGMVLSGVLLAATQTVNQTSPTASPGGLLTAVGAASNGDTIQFNFTTTSTIDLSNNPLTDSKNGLIFVNQGAAVTINPTLTGLFNVTGLGLTLGTANNNPTLSINTPINLADVGSAANFIVNSSSVLLGETLSVGSMWNVVVNQPFSLQGDLNFIGSNNTLSFNISNNFTPNVTLNSGLSITLSGNSTVTMNGNISGDAFFLYGSGTLILAGTNTYTGSTTILSPAVLSLSSPITQSGQVVVGGTLDVSQVDGGVTTIQNFEGTSGTVLLGSSTLTVKNTSAGTFDGVISGAGNLVISGSSSLELSGANTYTGSTTISQGTLILSGSATTIASSGSMVNNALLDVSAVGAQVKNLSGTGTVSLGSQTFTMIVDQPTISQNVFSGAGTLQKLGNGTMLLGMPSPLFTGDVQVNAGSIGVNIDYSNAAFEIGANGTIFGTGTLGDTVNAGKISPGNSIGTLTIDGNYSQTGILEIEISDDGQHDLLSVTQTATLTGGTLNIFPIEGIYYEGQTYTILTANSVVGTFNPITLSSITVSYQPQQVVLTVNKGSLPIENSDLSGYAAVMADALYCQNKPPRGDFARVAIPLSRLDATAYQQTLHNLVPCQISGLPIVEFENNSRILSWMQNRAHWGYDFEEECPDATVWATPISFWLWQRSNGEAFAFNANTSGIVLGFQHNVIPCLQLGLGTGYTFSGVNWNQGLGNAWMNEVYLAPYFTAHFYQFTLSASIMGSYDYTTLNRQIAYSVIDRIATSFVNELNMTVMGDLRAEFMLGNHFYVVPQGSVTYAQLYRLRAFENGAGCLDMTFPSETNSALRAIGMLSLGCRVQPKEFLTCGFVVDGGYQYTDLYSSNTVNATFIESSNFCDPSISTYGNQPAASQAIVGGGVFLENDEAARAFIKGQYVFLGRSDVVTVELNFESSF